MLVAMSCAPAHAFAQSDPVAAPAPAAAPATTPMAAPGVPHVPAGTPVNIELAEALSSKVLKRGDKFALRLAYPIVLDGKVIVPAGVTGVGQVVDVAASGALGRPAKLLLAARYLDFNGKQIPLRTLQLGRAGADNSDTIMAAGFVPYVGMLAMFMHGGEIEIPAGWRAQAKLAADIEAPPPAPDAGAAPATPSTPPLAEGPRQP
jgi:hypothetical protein